MITEPIAQRYAQTLFRLSQDQGRLAEVGEELMLIHRLYQETPRLKDILEHPLISLEKKFSLLRSVLKDKVSALSQRFLELIVRKGRLKYLAEILPAYQALVDRAKGIVRVKVRSFQPVTRAEEEQLKKRLSWLGAREIVLETTLDRSLLGGMMLQIGDTVLDGSVRRQLADLREYLLASVEHRA